MLALDRYGAIPETSTVSLTINSPFCAGQATMVNGWSYDISRFAQPPTIEQSRMAFDTTASGLNLGTTFAQATTPNPYGAIARQIQYKDLFSKYIKADPKTGNTITEQLAFLASVCGELSQNRPINIGLLLDDTFQTEERNGFIPTPNLATFTPVAGHALTVVGIGLYNPKDPSGVYVKFINSWGPSWGQNGFGFLKADYFMNVNIFGIEALSLWLNH